jgi:tetratricopeptide (TPR) repeat protein
MGLIHDDFIVSRGLTQPLSTLYSIATIIALLIFALLVRKKHYIISFGILWFFAGHSLESTFFPIELYFEHRNYLPSIGIVIAFSYIIIISIGHIQKKTLKTMAISTVVLTLILLVFQTFSLTTIWSNTPLQMAISYEKHPASIRAAHNYAISVNHENPVKAIQIYHDIFQKTNNLNGLILYAHAYCNYYNQLPFDVNSFLKESNELRPIGIIYFHLKELSESILKHQCASKSTQFLDYLYTAIENNSFLKYRGDDLARIYFVHADIAHSIGDTRGSIILLDESFHRRPTIDVLLRQTDLLLFRKEYQAALVYINKAQKMNNNRKLLQPDRSKEIVLKREYVLKLLNQSA